MPAPRKSTRRRAAPARRSGGSARKVAPRKRAAASLATYNAKRDFGRTSEPRGEALAGAGDSFVVQQHDATRMHFDFRLELDGVLLSWAIPKGPSLSPRVRRLAVQTEDHPIAYRNFEGTIPHGEYGGGSVIVWDRGRWTPESDPREGLRKGHLRFSLDGDKLHGSFSLIRTRGKVAEGPKSTWLLFKHQDGFARDGADADITERLPESVITQRTVREVGKPSSSGATKVPKTVKASKSRSTARTTKPRAAARLQASTPVKVSSSAGREAGGRTPPALGDVEVQLATLVDRPPAKGRWVYEVKFDGYRMLARLSGGKVEMRSRNQLDWTKTFPRIAQALGKLDVKSAILDGEVCHVDAEGRTSFQALQGALPRGGTGQVPEEQDRLAYYIFDVLFHDGLDVRETSLLERKQRLRILLGKKPPAPVVYSDHVDADGGPALNQACAAGLEGLIAKRADAPYRGGRGGDWVKLKCHKRQEFVIVGMSEPEGSRSGFGSLLLAVRDGDQLVYRGKVGTGFTQQSLSDLSKKLASRTVARSPLADPPKLRGITWVKPDLVCEVEFTEQTRDGSLRHPSFQGLRQDKPAEDVVQERAVDASATEGRKSGSGRKTRRPARGAASPTKDAGDATVAGVRISHPERVMDASSGLTKLDLARYHELVAPFLMPYGEGRPMAIVRCPQGDAQACFFQKQKLPGLGAAVKTRRIAGHETIYFEEIEGLVELVQFNAIEFHGWGARVRDPDHPDWLVMDLDPDTGLPFSAVIDAAREMRETLDRVGLRSFVKTTGGKGLHVVAPLDARADWTRVKSFAQAVARTFEERAPDRFVSTMSKAKRTGRIFVDYLRNGQGATAVIPYSPRARPGATVAMPIEWKDLGKIDPREYTVRSVPKILDKRKKDPWADFFRVRQGLPKSL